MTRERKQQFTLRITQANPTQLVVIIYEMLLCYLEEMEEAVKQQDSTAFHEGARKCRGCLNELLMSLHLEYEPAPQLQQLYLFCIRRLANAERKMVDAPLLEVKRVIQPLHDAYQQIEDQNDKGPVMNNSQTLYAGLTYDRNQLTENMADQGANRGMLI
ncbi:MAG: flagellar protein FliS [Lachnospiraceae bacterium]|nr:flagellar protein FliS [Lachnospiraceae bacterium]